MSKEGPTQYPDQRTPSHHFNDQVRIIHNTIYAMDKQPVKTATTEHRYEQNGHSHMLRSWKDGRETAVSWHSASVMPGWLTRILDIAKVGGHLTPVKFPPPSAILWFYTDDNNSLVSFTDIY